MLFKIVLKGANYEKNDVYSLFGFGIVNYCDA